MITYLFEILPPGMLSDRVPKLPMKSFKEKKSPKKKKSNFSAYALPAQRREKLFKLSYYIIKN